MYIILDILHTLYALDMLYALYILVLYTPSSLYHYKIIVVCPLHTSGKWKRFDLETPDAVSLAVEQKNLQNRQSL